MPAAGWYPDPDGSPDFRYWDGRAWTQFTSGDQRASSSPPGRRRHWGRLLGGLAVLLVILVVGAVAVFRPSGSDPNAATDPNGTDPSSTISSYDDGPTDSPSPTRARTPHGTPAPSGGAPTGSRSVACDSASPDQEPAPPADGRVHGGPLSFEQLPSPWSRPASTSRVPYSRDSSVQTLQLLEKLPWQASAQVGVTTFASFPGGPAATNAMLQCVLTSDFYSSVDVRLIENTTSSRAISGHRATQRDALLRFSSPDLKTTGSRLRFVVVESDPVTYYFSAVPMERSDLIAQLDAATRSLQVS